MPKLFSNIVSICKTVFYRKWILTTAVMLLFVFGVMVVPKNLLAYAGQIEFGGFEFERREHWFEVGSEASVFDNSEIIGEDVSARTATSKTFIMRDGTRVLQDYGVAIHYYVAGVYVEGVYTGGRYYDIDNTLFRCASSATYQNTANSFRVAFSDGTRDSALRIGDENRGFMLTPISESGEPISTRASRQTRGFSDRALGTSSANRGQDALASLSNFSIQADVRNNVRQTFDRHSAGVRRSGIRQGVDVNYTLSANTLTQSIHIASAKHCYTFSHRLTLNGLSANLNGYGDIYLSDTEGNITYIITRPTIKEANGEISLASLYLQYTNSSYILTIDANHHNFQEASFPVSIEPNVVQVVPNVIIRMGNYNMVTNTPLSTDFGFQNNNAARRNAFVQLNRPAINYGNLLGAFLNITYTNSSVQNFNVMARLLQGTPRSTLNVADNLYTISIASTSNTTGTLGFVADITNIVRANALNNNTISFSSRVTTSFVSFRPPILSLIYYCDIGIDTGASNLIQDMGVAGTGIVNLKTGSLNYVFNAVNINDGFMPIVVNLIYGQNFGDRFNPGNEFGISINWRTNFNQELYFLNGTPTLVNATGKRYYFYFTYSGWWINSQLGLTLHPVNSARHILVDRQGNSLVFQNSRLAQIHQFPSRTDNAIQGLFLQIEYNTTGLISSVTNGNTTVQFDYFLSLRHLRSIYVNGVRALGVEHSALRISQLRKYSQGSANITRFGYSGGRLASVVSGELNLHYTYFNDAVQTITTNKAGQESVINISYVHSGQGALNNINNVVVTTSTILSSDNFVRQLDFFGKRVVSDTTYEIINGNASQIRYVSAFAGGFNLTNHLNNFAHTKDILRETLNTLDFFNNTRVRGSATINTTAFVADERNNGSINLIPANAQVEMLLGNLGQSGTRSHSLSMWVRNTNPNNTVTINLIVSGNRVSYRLNRNVSTWQFVALPISDVANLNSARLLFYTNDTIQLDSLRLVQNTSPRLTYTSRIYTRGTNNLQRLETILSTNQGQIRELRYHNTSFTRYPGLIQSVTVQTRPNTSTAWQQQSRRVYSYNSVGHLTSIRVYGTNNTTALQATYTFVNNRLTSITDANGILTTFAQHTTGNTLISTSTTGGVETATRTNIITGQLESTTVGGVTSTVGTTTGGQTTQFGYDNAGRLNRVTHNNTHINFDYSGANLSEIRIGGNANAASNTLFASYTNSQTMSRVNYGNGGHITHNFNASGQLTNIDTSHSGASNFHYSNQGQLHRIDSVGGVMYSFATGRSSELAAQANKFTINNDGRVVEIHTSFVGANGMDFSRFVLHNNNLVSANCFMFNSVGQLASMNSMLGYIAYTYDTLGRLTRKQTGGLTQNFTYTGARVTTQTTTTTRSSGGGFAYAYHTNGNLRSITGSGVHAGVQMEFVYDNHNRLITEYNRVTGRIHEIHYDAGGNRQLLNIFTLNANGTRGTQLYTVQYVYNTTTWRDQLLGVYVRRGAATTGGIIAQTSCGIFRTFARSAENFLYDQVGNPLRYFAVDMMWQNGRQLARLHRGTTDVSFQYDVNGIRVQRQRGTLTTRYFLEGTRIVGFQRGTAFVWFHYDEQGIAGMYFNNQHYIFERNILGDVVAIWTIDGVLVGTYAYDAWGNHIRGTAVRVTPGMRAPIGNNRLHNYFQANPNYPAATAVLTINPFRYRGYYFDTEIGWYYLNTRWYDPSTGRFLNADLPQNSLMQIGSADAMNLFVYALNNPVMWTDETGRFVITTSFLIGLAIVVAAGATIGGIYGYHKADQWGIEGWQAVLIGAVGGGVMAGTAFVGGAMFFGAGLATGVKVSTGMKLGGLGVAFGGGFVGGAGGSAALQVLGTGSVDFGQAARAGLKWGSLNTIGMLGAGFVGGGSMLGMVSASVAADFLVANAGFSIELIMNAHRAGQLQQTDPLGHRATVVRLMVGV